MLLPPEELAAIAARRPGDPTPAVAATAGLAPGRGRGGSGDREQLARGRGVSQERAGEGAVTVPASGKITRLTSEPYPELLPCMVVQTRCVNYVLWLDC